MSLRTVRTIVIVLTILYATDTCDLYVWGQEKVEIDARAQAKPFPHFWEQMFGSGRAILTLRESYRDDLRAVKQITDFRYVRFHAILHDEVGVYNEDERGVAVYNFAYVDQIYDGLLHNGVRPIVEISFMPKKLAFNPDALHPFWYKQNVSPPKSIEKWDALMVAFAKHLVERYGIDEIAQWYFEVWNEPNIDFWGGVPRKRSYFEMYDHTARALKSVNLRIRVGGPATAAAQWVGDFLRHTAATDSPVDFISSHGYADDTVENMFGTDEVIPMEQRVCRAISKVHNEMKVAGKESVPLFWTEWNVPGMNQVRDTTFVGPALANTIRQCDGLVTMMSFWTFSDVFEESGPGSRPFVGQFGLRAEFGINKPSYYDFALLHKLGGQRLANASPNVIVTKTVDGDLVIVVWNLVGPESEALKTTDSRNITLAVHGVPPSARVTVERVDNEHGNVLPVYEKMGRPAYPTPEQVDSMNRATKLQSPEATQLQNGDLNLVLESNALALIKISNRW
ncbi:MAG: glycoside hydrolase family 39 [Edaphobacter sp.]|nr:glycoside hydrolase family 39 [Edaphobacter sp.]